MLSTGHRIVNITLRRVKQCVAQRDDTPLLNCLRNNRRLYISTVHGSNSTGRLDVLTGNPWGGLIEPDRTWRERFETWNVGGGDQNRREGDGDETQKNDPFVGDCLRLHSRINNMHGTDAVDWHGENT